MIVDHIRDLLYERLKYLGYHIIRVKLLNVNKQNKVVCKFDDLTKLQYKARRKAAEDRLNNIEKNKREKTVKFK